MDKRKLARIAVGVLACALVLTCGASVRADPIGPGFDLFQTDPGTQVTFPGIGVVNLMGVPIGGALGNTDTIVERLTGINPFPVGGTGMVPIQLFALQLRSTAPVNIGGSFFDVFVQGGTLFNQPENIGTLTAVHSVVAGGTFASMLPVIANVTFTNVNNPDITFVQLFSDTLAGGGMWSHTPAPGYNGGRFPNGGFFPDVSPMNGKAKQAQESGSAFSETHVFHPTGTTLNGVPEVGSASLAGALTFLVGGVAALRGRRRS
jgi:hypothetical protein